MENKEYKNIDGIKCYAPELAYKNDDYSEKSFSRLFELEDRNFWFRSRNKIIQELFRRYARSKKGKFLEIGCGTGYVLKGLKENFSETEYYGAEIYLEGIKYAQKRHSEIEFVQLDATNMPFSEEFEYAGAFDVLEHITDDEKVIKNVYNMLKGGGRFFISVPQYMWMWSAEDDKAKHKRRYTKKEMIRKLQNAGFSIKYYTSFVFALFPLMILSRFLKRNTEKNINKPNTELDLNPLMNKVFSMFMRTDEILIKLGIRLPWGGSLMVVGEKKGREDE